jgi:hypothetical protein
MIKGSCISLATNGYSLFFSGNLHRPDKQAQAGQSSAQQPGGLGGGTEVSESDTRSGRDTENPAVQPDSPG